MPGNAFRRIANTTFQTLLWCLVAGVVVQNVILIRQNRALRAPPAREEISAGRQLRNLAATGLDGTLRPIDLPAGEGQRLLIIGMSPVCPVCESSQGEWVKLAASLRQRAGWRILFVSRDPLALTSEFRQRTEIPSSEILADPPFRTYLQLGLHSVPRMIVVGDGGVVERVWSGGLDPAGWDQVFDWFHTPRPTLSTSIRPGADANRLSAETTDRSSHRRPSSSSQFKIRRNVYVETIRETSAVRVPACQLYRRRHSGGY